MPNQTEIAKDIGATQSAVSLWYQGKFKPHKMFRKQLEEKFPEQLKRMEEAYAKRHNKSCS